MARYAANGTRGRRQLEVEQSLTYPFEVPWGQAERHDEPHLRAPAWETRIGAQGRLGTRQVHLAGRAGTGHLRRRRDKDRALARPRNPVPPPPLPPSQTPRTPPST